MKTRPDTCAGCDLNDTAQGFMDPIRGTRPLLFLGEALGEKEAVLSKPFVGSAGFAARKLLRHLALEPEEFSWANAVWCRPPENRLEGLPTEHEIVAKCKQYWDPFIREMKPLVIMPLGNVPLHALTGHKEITKMRGYPIWSPEYACWIVPTVHPSFIIRGQTGYATCFLSDVQKALRIIEDGGKLAQPITRYLLDPTPLDAERWALEWLDALRADDARFAVEQAMSYDIETPFKTASEEEDEIEEHEGPDPITRIGFSWKPYDAMSIPWAPEYMPVIERILTEPSMKIVWNGDFDTPRIEEASGFKIVGRYVSYGPWVDRNNLPGLVNVQVIDDGMWAWHILHCDQRKSLGHVGSMVLHEQLPWKHLAGSALSLYNCIDADVAKRIFVRVLDALRRN